MVKLRKHLGDLGLDGTVCEHVEWDNLVEDSDQ
jgi:hypothetical protein